MAKRGSTTVQVADLDVAIKQTLTLYHQDVNERIDAAAQKAVKDLVNKTKATAPVGARGSFAKSIAWKQSNKSRFSSTYVWHVKAPNYRLTHLLVHGHATKNGGRTRANSFLHNAWDEVRKVYEEDIEEALTP